MSQYELPFPSVLLFDRISFHSFIHQAVRPQTRIPNASCNQVPSRCYMAKQCQENMYSRQTTIILRKNEGLLVQSNPGNSTLYNSNLPLTRGISLQIVFYKFLPSITRTSDNSNFFLFPLKVRIIRSQLQFILFFQSFNHPPFLRPSFRPSRFPSIHPSIHPSYQPSIHPFTWLRVVGGEGSGSGSGNG